jgi:nucleoside 2-deoxyribosyltransferase
MKIFMIGSTAYQDKIKEYAEIQKLLGNEVLIPVFDNWENATVLDILTENRRLMRLADEVHMIYDGRSDGTKFDFGMCFAMEKPLKIVYMNKKTLVDGMYQYEKILRSS